MRILQLTGKSGADGLLHLTIPAEAGTEFDVAVVVQPKAGAQDDGRTPTPEELGWPPGYFEATFGSIQEETFVAPVGTPPRFTEPLS